MDLHYALCSVVGWPSCSICVWKFSFNGKASPRKPQYYVETYVQLMASFAYAADSVDAMKCVDAGISLHRLKYAFHLLKHLFLTRRVPSPLLSMLSVCQLAVPLLPYMHIALF